MRPAAAGVLLVAALAAAAPAVAAGDGAFRSWRSLRDAGVVRQQRDFSCGLAALATLLSHYYRRPATEASLLARLLGDAPVAVERRALVSRGVSLAELARLAADHGLQARGVAVRASALARLRVPAIAYLEEHGVGHFTVLRRVAAHRVQLADPAAGNVSWSRRRFRAAFSTDGGRGRLLLLGDAATPPAPGPAVDRPLPLLRRARRAVFPPPLFPAPWR